MKRGIEVVLASLLLCAPLTAQVLEEGWMTLTFLRIRQPDGTMREYRNVPVPYRMERIRATPWRSRATSFGEFTVQASNTIAYRNDNGNESYFYTPEMSSALDDITLDPVGFNREWRTMTFGYNADDLEFALVRWIVFDTFVPGRGAGRSAFDGVIADFGTIRWWPAGQFKLTVDLAGSGFTFAVPDGECYVAQQYREPDPSGEGPFIRTINPIFSGRGVTIGSSADAFFFDSDENGIYDETEIDWFDGPPNEANFLWVVTVGGSIEIALPTQFEIPFGAQAGGNLQSLWSSDDNRLAIQARRSPAVADPAMQLLINGGISPGRVSGLKFILESQATYAIPVKIEWYNFAQGRWDTKWQGTATQTDSVVEVAEPNRAAEYVSSSNTLRVRVSWFDNGITDISWGCAIDQAVWHVIRP